MSASINSRYQRCECLQFSLAFCFCLRQVRISFTSRMLSHTKHLHKRNSRQSRIEMFKVIFSSVNSVGHATLRKTMKRRSGEEQASSWGVQIHSRTIYVVICITLVLLFIRVRPINASESSRNSISLAQPVLLSFGSLTLSNMWKHVSFKLSIEFLT